MQSLCTCNPSDFLPFYFVREEKWLSNLCCQDEGDRRQAVTKSKQFRWEIDGKSCFFLQILPGFCQETRMFRKISLNDNRKSSSSKHLFGFPISKLWFKKLSV